MTKVTFLFTVVLLFVATGCQAQKSDHDQVCFGRSCFDVEVVSSSPERERGLQHREYLDPEAGMLFIFQQSWPYTFWMKDTLIPLDMIWMDYTRKVVHIEHDVQPCKEDPCPHYGSRNKALYVLELNAGKARSTGIKVGDVAKFNLQIKDKN